MEKCLLCVSKEKVEIQMKGEKKKDGNGGVRNIPPEKGCLLAGAENAVDGQRMHAGKHDALIVTQRGM